MSNRPMGNALERQLARLRQEFDSAFAEPVRSMEDRADRLMCFSVGSTGFAIAMSGLQNLVRCTGITPIPARAPGLLGLAVVRAQIVPVYSLPQLTGIGTQSTENRWLFLLQGPTPVALALDSLDGYVLATAVQSATGNNTSPLVAGLVEHGGKIYAAVRAGEIYNTITVIAPENERDT